MKTIEMTKDEVYFIGEVLGIFRKLNNSQQIDIIEQLKLPFDFNSAQGTVNFDYNKSHNALCATVNKKATLYEV